VNDDAKVLMLRLLLPALLLATALSQIAPTCAWLFDIRYIPHNDGLEGSRIMATRAENGRGEHLDNLDILLIGSSRTMADFSSDVIARNLSENGRPVRAYNLGNLGNDWRWADANLTGTRMPRVLVLEFSPHLFAVPYPTDTGKDWYDTYREWVAQIEVGVSGTVREGLGLHTMLKLNHASAKAAYRALTDDTIGLADLFFYLRYEGEGGQMMRDDGQVYYHSFLPDRSAGQGVRAFGIRGLDPFAAMAGQSNPSAWNAFDSLLRRAIDHCEIVIVRPPVDSAMYDLENSTFAEIITRMCSRLKAYGIPYIDLNPHPYFSTDMSHIDWYETTALSRELARRMAPHVSRALARDGRGAANTKGLM
jgi:hypothetical protein